MNNFRIINVFNTDGEHKRYEIEKDFKILGIHLWWEPIRVKDHNQPLSFSTIEDAKNKINLLTEKQQYKSKRVVVFTAIEDKVEPVGFKFNNLKSK